jgi:hypothetical protein
MFNDPSEVTEVFCNSSLSDRSLPMVLLLCVVGPPPLQGSAPATGVVTLYTVRIDTCRSLDRHDYTHSIEVPALHIHLDVDCLFCLFN